MPEVALVVNALGVGRDHLVACQADLGVQPTVALKTVGMPAVYNVLLASQVGITFKAAEVISVPEPVLCVGVGAREDQLWGGKNGLSGWG